MLNLNLVRQRICLDPQLNTADYTLVTIQTAKADQCLSKDPYFYVGPNGIGGDPGKYNGARRLIEGESPIYSPEFAFYKKLRGIESGIIDGRHRFAYLRDIGLNEIPVAIKKQMVPLLKVLGLIK